MAGNYVTEASVKATGITMVVLSSLIAGLRLFLAISEQRKFQWADGWLLAAYVFFMVLSILYLVATPTMFKVTKVANGDIEPYPSIADDGLFIQKTFFVTTSGLWLCLWCVKLSLMAVYKRLMAGLKHYIRIWWAVIVFCLVVLTGAITSSMLSCSSMKAWFTAGACNTPRDIRAASISLWYSYAVDIVTDLMIMLLPIGLIWKLQMPLMQKLSIGGLFCLGFVCIAVATIRVRELGSTVNNSQPSTTWLALWGIVESSIAVIVGCGPGLYRKAKAIYQTQQASYPSRGYARYNSGARELVDERDIKLPSYHSRTFRTTTSARHQNNATSSQEELANTNLDTGITVTKTVTVGVQERDADSMRYWNGRPHAY